MRLGAHYKPLHEDLLCLQIQLFLSLVLKELTEVGTYHLYHRQDTLFHEIPVIHLSFLLIILTYCKVIKFDKNKMTPRTGFIIEIHEHNDITEVLFESFLIIRKFSQGRLTKRSVE